uniref:Uncharacterized protein LOC105634413 n=1 Tax=Rhizophora mucronata TaxID=61149 RepID=A0A2P2KFA6_RHIMU
MIYGSFWLVLYFFLSFLQLWVVNVSCEISGSSHSQASNIEDRTHDTTQSDASASVKLDAAAKAHIEKHRKLQEDLTDEMVGLAQQLKESSLMMNQSVQNTERILDSTEKAVEQSLAGTGRANVRALEVYSKSSKTTCFTWLVMFLMTCIFIMVVLLIRVT